MAEEARWSISFCCVRDGGRSVGVLVPDLRGVLVGVSSSATFGIDLFLLRLPLPGPDACDAFREGKKLLFGVPAEPSPSMKRDTKSLPGVSTNVDPALWLSSRGSWWFDTTVAAMADIWGAGVC